jgi:formate hydrogenlyase subunit 4
MFYSLTLISVFEVLLEIVPMLLAVAYITVAERKTMASMQRRLGPNAVGYNNKLRLYESKRFYHNSSINSDKEAIKELYKNRIAPVKEFDCDVIHTCTNLVSLDEINSFFKELKGVLIHLYLYKYILFINSFNP